MYPTYVTLLSLWLTLLSSAINPWLYSILNHTFRVAMHKSAMNFLQKVTHGRLGNDDFGFGEGETTRQRNSYSHDNIADKKSEEGTPTRKSATLNQRDKVEAIKLEPVKETRDEIIYEDGAQKMQIPGQVETPKINQKV